MIQHDYEWHGKMVTVSAVEVTDQMYAWQFIVNVTGTT